MASRRPSRQRDDLFIEEIDESELDLDPVEPEPKQRPTVAVRGTTGASLLQVSGYLALIAGLGLLIGAGLDDGVGHAASRLGSVGLHPGLLVVAGLALAAFGRIRRGQIELMLHSSSHDDGLLEQVAATQVRARNSLERLARAHTEQVDAMGVLREQVQVLLDAQQQPDDGSAQAQEAIFRMAASLDQLGARVEQRMQGQFETFQAVLQQFGNDIVGAQDDLRSLLAQAPAGYPAPEPQVSFDEPLPQGEPADELVDFEPEAPLPAPGAESLSSLGVLDSIPDETSEPLAPLRSGSIGPIPGSGGKVEETGEYGISIQKHAGQTPVERAMELDTQTKLTQLTDLLADDRLRAALEEMRRGD